MKFFWSIHAIPELAALPRAERWRLWRLATVRSRAHWQYWASLLLGGLCGVCGFLLGCAGGATADVHAWDRLLPGLGALLGGGVGGLIHGQVVTRLVRRSLPRRETASLFI